jgi:hypothetical protein
MGNATKYSILVRIERDLIAIRASFAASTSEKIFSDFRSSLTPKIVKALFCTQFISQDHPSVLWYLSIILLLVK